MQSFFSINFRLDEYKLKKFHFQVKRKYIKENFIILVLNLITNRKLFMKIYFLIVIIFLKYSLLSAQPENPGPYKAGWTNVVLNRDGRNLNCLIYYPAFSEGSETQIDTIHNPYHIVAFGHGFFMQNSYYISLYKHLASYGFVVIAPQFPDYNHLELSFDLIHCINYLKKQNSIATSRFYKLLDTTKSGVSGHSMGGGSSLLAGVNDKSITVIAPLAPAETNPSVINQMQNIKSIIYIIAAQNDGITPVASNQLPMFNNARPIKTLLTIKGGNHTKFMDVRTWDWTDPNGNISADKQLSLTRRYITSIYNLFLKEDTSFFKYAYGEYAKTDNSIEIQTSLIPLIPKPFKTISPVDTVRQKNIIFKWNKTFSLNLYDTIKYELIIANDSSFTDIYHTETNISDTIISVQLQLGQYFWKVKAYSSDSTFIFSDTKKIIGIIPSKFNEEKNENLNNLLEQNFPNPFNNTTRIKYKVSNSGLVKLTLFNILGEPLETLINEHKSKGEYELNIDGKHLSSGTYFYEMIFNHHRVIKKFILLK